MPDDALRALLTNNGQETVQNSTNVAGNNSYAAAASIHADDRSSSDSSGYLQLNGWPITSEILQSANINRISSLDNMGDQINANNLGLLDGVNLIDDVLGEPYAQNLSLPHSGDSPWPVLMGGNPLTGGTHMNPLMNPNANLLSMLNNGADTSMNSARGDFSQFVLGIDHTDDNQQMADLAIQSSTISSSTTNANYQTYSTPSSLNYQLADSVQPSIYHLSSIPAVPKPYPTADEPSSSNAQSIPLELTSHYHSSCNNTVNGGIASQSNRSVYYQTSPSTDSQNTPLPNIGFGATNPAFTDTNHRRQNTETVLKSCGLYDATILTGSLVKRDKLISTQISDIKRDLLLLQQSLKAE